MEVDYNKYKEQEFTCSKCGWAGKGEELSHGDFHEYSFIGDLECPNCSHLVAFWQASHSKDEKD
jgi:ribosomal protein S27AE